MLEVLAPIALILIVVAGFVGVFWMFRSFRRKNEKMRDEPAGQALAELARQRGWTYEPENTGFADHVTDHPVYGGASKNSKAFQLLTGIHRNREFGCFQYRSNPGASPGDGDVSVYYYRLYVLPLSTSVPLLRFEPAKTSPVKKGKVVTGDPEFDQAFVLLASDEQFTAAVLAEPVRRWLLSDPRASRTPVRFYGNIVLHFYQQHEPFDVGTVEPTLDFLCDLLDRIPSGLVR